MKRLKPIFGSVDQTKKNQNKFWSSLNSSEEKNHIELGNSSDFFYNCDERRSKDILKILKESGLLKDDSIVEIGSNCGRNINHIKASGYPNVLGIEINKTAIEFGVSNYDLLSDSNFLLGSVEDVLDQVPKVDWVFTMAVLVHLTNEQKNKIYEWIKQHVNKGVIFVEQYDDCGKTHHFGLEGHWFKRISKEEMGLISNSPKYEEFRSIGYKACIMKKESFV